MSLLTELLLSFFVAVAVASGGYYFGHKNGVNEQKALDQAQFDTINKERSRQKADAAQVMQKAYSDLTYLLEERAKFKSELEEKHANDVAATDAVRSQLLDRRLRFRAAPNGADRACSSSPSASQASPAVPRPPAVVLISEATGRALRALAYEADKLLDNYKLCYAYVNGDPEESRRVDIAQRASQAASAP